MGDGASNHRRLDCLLRCLLKRRSKKTSTLRVSGLCKGNPPVTGGFPSERASNVENVFVFFIWWRHHATNQFTATRPITRECWCTDRDLSNTPSCCVHQGWFQNLRTVTPFSNHNSWWRHQMETFSALLALCEGTSPVTGELPSQRPVTRSFDVFFDLRLNKRLSKPLWGWWFETPSRSLWRHCNVKDLGFVIL